MNYKLRKNEILREYKLINLIKNSKNIFKTNLLSIKYLYVNKIDNSNIKCLFYIPKKLFKKAVDRNKLRRRIKESFRLNKHNLYIKNDQLLILSIMYINKDIESFKNINDSILKIINIFL